MRRLSPYASCLALMLLGAMPGSAALAGQSLEQVRYALFKDPAAPVEADLRLLAAKGDRASKHLLGNVLASDQSKVNEAVVFYKEAFDDGHGEIPALSSMARLMDRNPRLRLENLDYVRGAVRRYPQERDVRNLATTLEVFVAYPEFFSPVDVARMITLYERSCLLDCRGPFYRAVLAQRDGQVEQAKHLYEQAMMFDVRAVERYYNLLGEQRDPLFAAFAQTQVEKIDRMPVEIVHSIGAQLDGLSNTRAVGLRYPLAHSRAELRQLPQAEADVLKAADDETKSQIENESKQLRGQAAIWIDKAVERGFVPAMVAKVNSMTAVPAEHSSDAAMALIERIEQSEPTRAKALRVSVLLINTWPSLDPVKAHGLIEELIAARYPDGPMLLGDLYSHGGLDEPDQYKALDIYQGLAANGAPGAYYRIASVYASSRAICYDPVNAYAYARTAVELGDNRARTLMLELERRLPRDTIAQGLLAHTHLLEEATP